MAYLALGSNIDPARHLALALAKLRQLPYSTLVAESSWYRTAPWGGIAQADFINLVVAFETSLNPLDLLAATQKIESQLGRQREVRYGPRSIDLDWLLIGAHSLDHPTLSLPHPGLLERDFMLIPLLELNPKLPDSLMQPLIAARDQLNERWIVERVNSSLLA